MFDGMRSPEDCNCGRIRRAARNITRYYDASLAPAGIGANQFSLLGYLSRVGPMRMARLAELLVMDRATIGHNLRPLERDGLVEMTTDAEDRRARLVSITPAGLAKLELAMPVWNEAQAYFESHFGVSESGAMRGMMDVIADMPLMAQAA